MKKTAITLSLFIFTLSASASGSGRISGGTAVKDHSSKVATVKTQATDFESAKREYSQGKISADSIVSLGLKHKSENPISAEPYLKLAASNGNQRGMMELGSLYLFSPEFSAVHSKDGLKLLEEAVNAGNENANDYLALYYFQNKDYHKAKNYLDARRSSTHYGFAYAALGSMYLEGKGVREDGKKARENYLQSALKGYSRGMSLYANLLGTKNGGSFNYPDAFFWHYIAGELGENYSRVMLYRPRIPEKEANGEVARDAQQALQWIEKVHSGKNLKNEPVYKNGFLVGLKEREKAAENGDDWSRFYLGSMNYNGDFLNQNFARAIRYYEPISENGKLPENILKIVNQRLSEMYETGKGTKADPTKATLYKKRADK